MSKRSMDNLDITQIKKERDKLLLFQESTQKRLLKLESELATIEKQQKLQDPLLSQIVEFLLAQGCCLHVDDNGESFYFIDSKEFYLAIDLNDLSVYSDELGLDENFNSAEELYTFLKNTLKKGLYRFTYEAEAINEDHFINILKQYSWTDYSGYSEHVKEHITFVE